MLQEQDMFKEALKALGNKLAPQPSKKLESFNCNVLNGSDPRIPLYDGSSGANIQCYGMKKGEERERIFFP